MTATTVDYHSIYLPAAGAEPRQRWSGGKSVAFVHDLLGGNLPSEYAACDVLYGDLPWRAGFDAYNERAKVSDGRTHRGFLRAVAGAVDGFPGPAVLITGRHALHHLPRPDQTLDVTISAVNQPGLALVYRTTLQERLRITTEILAELAARHERIGDFCCGYGRSARAFTRAGKTFVASDLNPECIGFIAQHAGAWRS